MYWDYLKLGLTRTEAENKILSIGFISAQNKGWELKIKNGERFHIVPCDCRFNIHRDSKNHKVKRDKKTKIYLNRFRNKLNTFSFEWKIKLFFRRLRLTHLLIRVKTIK